ncbi:hypothetical protein, partial [Myceligenerans pegani]
TGGECVMSEITECPRCGAHNVVNRQPVDDEGWWTCRACQAHGPGDVERCLWGEAEHPAEPGYLMCTEHLAEHLARYGPGARAKDGDRLVEQLELDEAGRATVVRALAAPALALMVYAAFDHRTGRVDGRRVCVKCGDELDGDEDDDVALILHRLTAVGHRIAGAPVPPSGPPGPVLGVEHVSSTVAVAGAEEPAR